MFVVNHVEQEALLRMTRHDGGPAFPARENGVDCSQIEIRFLTETVGEYQAEVRIVSDAVNGDITIPLSARTEMPVE